ncbi:unnamed protein product [Mytilus coruscus]|uniref:DUF6589 domain-containing protein n=1 Tax=Mytilus coruscus TaxID=42192 RepID=A0A6J8D5N7_MYTCO|nr:unnamed protein product [Mytilus coruscus]
MLHVAFKHIPYFTLFEKVITKQIVGPFSEQLKKKHKVVPLPVLHLNEQKYDDVVKIMDYHENFLSDTYEKAGVDLNNNTHIHYAYTVEAITHFFDMESVFSAPRKNELPDNVCTEDQKKEWVMDMFQKIVEIYMWDKEKKKQNQHQEDNVEVDGVVIPIQLSNGKRWSYVIKKAQKSQTAQEDKVKNYGHLCLELGLQFKAILDLCKLPDRDRGLRLLKVCMIHFKANNNLSKYAYEILRLLVHQLCILSEQEAHEEFYGLFVNTKGKMDSHIPCDLQMEYIVKSVKRNIKHMFSNKTGKNITTRTSALPAIKD